MWGKKKEEVKNNLKESDEECAEYIGGEEKELEIEEVDFDLKTRNISSIKLTI